MKTPLVLTLLLLTAGCSTVSDTDRAWYIMHAVDVAQTYQISQNPGCHGEGNPVTQSLIGVHPSGEEVILWGLATAALHHVVSPHLPEWLSLYTTAGKAHTVDRNSRRALALTSSGCYGYEGDTDAEIYMPSNAWYNY